MSLTGHENLLETPAGSEPALRLVVFARLVPNGVACLLDIFTGTFHGVAGAQTKGKGQGEQ